MKKTLLIAISALCLLGLMGCKKTYKPKTVTVNNKETIEKYSAYKMQKIETYEKNGSLKSEKGFLGNLSTNKNNEIFPLYESNKYSVNKLDLEESLNHGYKVYNKKTDTSYIYKDSSTLYSDGTIYLSEPEIPIGKISLVKIIKGDINNEDKRSVLTEYYYDKSGNVSYIETVYYARDHQISGIDNTTYQYDSCNNLTYEAKISGPLIKELQTKKEFFYENKYDSKNNLIYQKTTDEQGEVICEDYYEYEENKLINHKSYGGLSVTKNILYEEGINNIKDYSFLYSIGGIPFDPLDPDTHCWLEETFEYGKNGKLSSRTIEIGAHNGNSARLSASMTETYRYKYNSDGSLAEKQTDINILGVYPGTQINRSFFRKTAD